MENYTNNNMRKSDYNDLFIVIFMMFCILGAGKLSAQDVTQSEEITVVAPYQPTVSDAFKINVSPRIPDERLNKPDFNYSILTKKIKTGVTLDPIVPAKIMGESVSKLYKNYIKAGFGNYITPYLEFSANKLRSRKNAFGVHVKHLSSSGKIKDYAYPGNTLTRFSAYGKKLMKHHTFFSDLYYKRTGVHYYGFRPDEFPEFEYENKDIKQNFNLLGFHTSYSSNYKRAQRLNHKLGLDYYFLSDKPGAQEHNINFDAGLNKNFRFFSFSDDEKLGLDLNLDYYFNSDKILPSHNSGIVEIKPFYTLGFDQYNFGVGFKTAIELDTSTQVHIYPMIHLEVKVVQDYLITYAGINGELKKNSLKSFSDENPFIAQNIEKRFSNDKFSQYGGLKGKITNYLDYNLSFVNSTVENMPFFVNDTLSVLGEGLNNQFTVVYDKVKYSRLIAEFGFHYKEKFNAVLKGKYNSYFLDNEDEAWHKPGLEITLNFDYSMQNKILLKAGIITRSKMYAKAYEDMGDGTIITKAEQLDGMFDFNLGAEYRYSSLLSGFITFNNILGQQYFNWYNYPSYRFNMMIGVAYSF